VAKKKDDGEYHGTHRADEPKSFGTGERKNASPDGWSDKRIEVDKSPGVTEVYGFGADGVEGYRRTGN